MEWPVIVEGEKRGTEIESERPGGERRRNHSCFHPPPSASPNHPDTRRRQNQKPNKWTEPPVKGKTQTTESLHIYSHTHMQTRVHIPCMNSPLVCSRAERDSSVPLSATTAVIYATALAWKHSNTEATVSSNLFICLGGMRFFFFFNLFSNAPPSAELRCHHVHLQNGNNKEEFCDTFLEAGKESNFSHISGGSIVFCIFSWRCLPPLIITSIIQIVEWMNQPHVKRALLSELWYDLVLKMGKL